MTITSTRTDVCSISLARTSTGRVRVTSRGRPFRAITLSTDAWGARVALVPDRALLLAGDAIDVAVVVADGLTLHLQETSGTVAYDMRGGSASWSFCAHVGADARLVLDALPWVSASGSRVVRSLSVSLEATAVLLARETLILGRSGEAPGWLNSHTTVTRAGRPVLVEELRTTNLAPYRVLDSVLAVGRHHIGQVEQVAPLRLEAGDLLWRRLGREAHETAAVLEPLWAVLIQASMEARSTSPVSRGTDSLDGSTKR
jgi:urease accessory protein